MTDLFNVTFEDGKFIPDIGTFGNYAFCSGGTIEIISNPGSMLGNYCMAVTPRAGSSNYANLAYLCRNVGIQKRYRQRFYFDPNSISMSTYKNAPISRGGSYLDHEFDIVLYYSSGYYIMVWIREDDKDMVGSTPSVYAITDDVHYIEIDWKASTNAGANNGHLDLWIDGVHKGSTTPTIQNVDNDTRFITFPKIGCPIGISATYSGTIYFDNWKANNDGSVIGA